MGKIFDYDGVPVLHTTSGDLKVIFMTVFTFTKEFRMHTQTVSRCRFRPNGMA